MDLELLQDLSKFDFPSRIKIRSKSSRNKGDDDKEDILSCSTPTSQEHKIPTVTDSPPPPPRKPRSKPSSDTAAATMMTARSCKRKLLVSTCEVIMNREEIDRFFSSVYSEALTTKRRRSYPNCDRR
ncbi:unnamed protein product [Cochlearia groenlandica]